MPAPDFNPNPVGSRAWQQWQATHPNQPSQTGQGQPSNQPPSSPGGLPDPSVYQGLLQDQPYANTPGFQSLIRGFVDNLGQRGWTPQQVKDMVSGYAQTFHDQFVNKVGAEPSGQDYSTFFQSYLTPSQPWMQPIPPGQYQSDVSGSIANLFSGRAQDVAQQKAADLAAKETAPGSAFDVWQGDYQKSLNDTEQQLQDFQSRLFEKIRPNLLTSLKAQGLLDTGALNTALAGTAGDLTSEAQRYMSGARTQAAQDIAGKKFAISSAPGNFALGNLFNVPGNISQSGQDALTNLYNQEAQTNAFNAQKQLYSSLPQDQPSELSRIGGTILGGVAAGGAYGLGSRLAMPAAAAVG